MLVSPLLVTDLSIHGGVAYSDFGAPFASIHVAG